METKKCPNCGASLNIGSEDHSIICNYCGSTLVDNDHNEKVEKPEPDSKEETIFSSQLQANLKEKISKIKFNLFIFILLLICFWPLAIVYLILAKYKEKNN